ncbi:M24 family metallopeptidase [Primorskyibacter sp. S187A]|uniref:M24 family metallopeptidase n=1 Tax=Primorskyibacter sp. S187A TaxID=3415130 RepID=UPI003C7C91F9
MIDLPSRGFERAEFKTRIARAQEALQMHELDGLLVMSEPEIQYFAGFQTQFWLSPTRSWFLFVPSEGNPTAIIPEIGADLMRDTWVSDIRTWPAPCPEDDGISLLTDLLLPFSQRNAAIGVMKGHETYLRMPLADWERLINGLPGMRVADATKQIQSIRMIKSPTEIEKVSAACEIGSAAFEQIPSLFKPAMSLEALFREFKRCALALGADNVPYLVGASDQGGYRNVISPPSRRPLHQGDVLMLDTGLTWDGYYCDFDRNWRLGHVSDQVHHVYEVLWDATEAGLEAIKPGKSAFDVFNAMSKVVSKASSEVSDIGRLGHGLGIQLTEQPSLASFDETELKENMVLTLEPAMSYGDGKIMVHEENIVVEANGARLLSKRAPQKLPNLL